MSAESRARKAEARNAAEAENQRIIDQMSLAVEWAQASRKGRQLAKSVGVPKPILLSAAEAFNGQISIAQAQTTIKKATEMGWKPPTNDGDGKMG